MESIVEVKVICSSPFTIMPFCDIIVEEGDNPATLTEIREFLKEYKGTRLRHIDGDDYVLGLADMVPYVLEYLPVSGFGGSKEVSGWNKLPTQIAEGGRRES